MIGQTLIGPDGTIYITKNKNNRTYAVAITPDGREKWIGPEESEVFSIASDGTLFIRDVGQLEAIGGHGNIVWKAQLPEDTE